MSRRHKGINKVHVLLHGELWHIVTTGKSEKNSKK